jgi:hypothetical protein
MNPDFPFVGAGSANYFEFAEMFVHFTRSPKPAEAGAIAKRVPEPLRDTIEWHGPILWVASEQGVGRLIKAAYGTKTKPSKLTQQSRFAMASPSAYRAFDADVDAWLEFVHTLVPVRLAYRRPDAEAGGTTLSAWHHESVAAIPNTLVELTKLAKNDDTAAHLGLALVEEARIAKVRIDPKLGPTLEKLHDAHKHAKEEERADRWESLAAAATKALGKPSAKVTKLRALADLEPALARLEKVLPLTARRLRRMATKGLTVRPGANAAAIASAERALGAPLSKAHRALLEAFDGGDVGNVVFLGTPAGGAARDGEVAAFTLAWSGAENDSHTIIARTGRDHVVAVPRRGDGPTSILAGKAGWGGGRILRESKQLDTALDLVLKAGSVHFQD